MNTKQLKEKILSLAIQGKLVPRDQNDEPAIELLKRINSNIQPIVEDIPFEIPNGWCWVRGKQVLRPMESTKPKGEFTYIDVDAVNNKSYCIKKPKYLSIAPSRATRKLHENDVLFSMVRPYLKKIAFVTEDFKDAIASTGFYVLTPLEALFPKYLFYMMLSNYVVLGLNSFMKGDNSPSINNNHIEDYLFPIPPFFEQHRIVEKVESLFTLIDNIEKNKESIKENINATRQKLLTMAIQGELVPQDPNDEPAVELLKRINPQFTPLQYDESLPQGWISCQMGILIDIISGVSYKKDDIKLSGIRILRGGNIQDGKIHKYTDDIFLNEAYYNSVNSVYKGDVVMVASTGSIDVLGKIGYCYDNMDSTQIGAFLRIIRSKELSIAPFLYLVLLSDTFKKHIRKLAKGTNINNIRNNYIIDFIVNIPPLAEQKRIVDKLELLFAQLDNLEKNT